jgi:pimeloyl-ACP methyl ester carboxylesterase
MEQEAVSRIQHWRLTEGGYIAEQSTKPHSLAPGLNDSPVGLAAWLVEKLRSWSDCGADLESVLARDELLTWVTAYWVTGTIGSSFSGYVEPPNPLDRLETPTVMSCHRRDINVMPRAFVERFLNIRVWNDHDAGGHFAAWEQPQSYARGVREALAL